MIMDLAIEYRKMCWNLMGLLRQGEQAIITAADSSNVLCAFALIVILITLPSM